MKYWDKNYVKHFLKARKPTEVPPEKVVLEFDDIHPYFYILLIGFCAALLAFVIEKYCKKERIEIQARAGSLKVERRRIQSLPENLKLRKFPIPEIRPKTA